MPSLRLTLVLATGLLVGAALAGETEHGHADHKGHDAQAHPHAPKVEVIGNDAKNLRYVKVLDLNKEADRAELINLYNTTHVHEVVTQSEPSIPFLASISTELGVWTLVIFGGLFLVLRKMAWPKMLAGLHAREHNILSAREDAEKARTEAAAMRTDLQQQLAGAHSQVKGIIDEAKRDAEATAKGIRDQAAADAAAERTRMQREIQTATDQAMQSLWTKAAELATQASSKALRKQLDGDGHKRLIDEALKELQAAGASSHA